MTVLEAGTALADYFEEASLLIGVVTTHSLGVVDELMIQRYAMAIGSTDPRNYEREAARSAGFAGVIAPPNMLSAIFEWGTGTPEENLNADGTPPRAVGRGGLRGMGVGEEIEIFDIVVAGTELFLDEKLCAVEAKVTRSGPCVFLVTEHIFRNCDGKVFNTNRRTVALQNPIEVTA